MLEKDTGLAYIYISQEILKRFGVKMSETEDLIDNLRALKTHKIAAIFKQLRDGTIRVSLRSKNNIDIGTVARKLGGGGHRVAAGYTSSQKDFEKTLNELREEIIEAGWGTGN